MNKNNLRRIFDNYIRNFYVINDLQHSEFYKWQICYKYRNIMDKALSCDISDFPKLLKKAKECTENIIDGYTAPFNGLVEFAKNEPETVKSMFVNLYRDDDGLVDSLMKRIEAFFNSSYDLLSKYYPDSFLFKQNSHSVSSYLFLYDPEKYFMYKAKECNAFADCIEFYDSWGTGDNIDLNVFHKMCNEVLEEIKTYEPLLAVNNKRFTDELNTGTDKLHEDKNLHILLFDIIWCCGVYNLFDGIDYGKLSSSEKKEYLLKQAEAEQCLKEYQEACLEEDLLHEAIETFIKILMPGTQVKRRKEFGIVDSIDEKFIHISFDENEVKSIGLAFSISNNIITSDKEGFLEAKEKYKDVLKREKTIIRNNKYALDKLEKYKEFIS